MAIMNFGLGGASGYGENSFKSSGVDEGNLDDGSIAVDITPIFGPGGIDFYGDSYTELHIGTNGLITFDDDLTTYVSSGLASYDEAAIAAFWSDIDISKGGDIYWDVDSLNGALTITWLDVAPYSGSGTNSFQVVLSNLGSGNFEVEFIYEDIQWATSYGSDATAGLTDGDDKHYEVPGSGDPSQVLNYPSTDFGTGDPLGVFSINVVGGGVVPCFCSGTRILTARGAVPVEQISPGDQLWTLDADWLPVLWAGRQEVSAQQMAVHPNLLPVTIRPNALGNTRRLRVSQQHAFLVGDRLVRAKHLAEVCGGRVPRISPHPRDVTYHHLLTPQHSLIQAEGAWTETLFPGTNASGMLTRAELQAVWAALARSAPAAQKGRAGLKPARAYATRKDLLAGHPPLEHGSVAGVSDLYAPITAAPPAASQDRWRWPAGR